MKLEIAKYVKVGMQNNILFIGFGSIQFLVENTAEQKEYLLIMQEWLKPHTEEEILKKFSFLKRAPTIVKKFKSSHILMPTDTYNSKNRYSRQALYFQLNGLNAEVAQKQLATKRIAIVGCGGIGNLLSVNLSTAGVGHLHLMDSDVIETSNLSRQILFTENDIGKEKVEILKKALLARNSSTTITTQAQEIKCEDDLISLKSYDLIVLSADSYGVIHLVNRFCIKNNIPYLNICYVNDIAVWGPFVIPGKTGCMECQNIVSDEGTQPEVMQIIKNINTHYQAPSIGPINMLSSSLASVDVLKFLVNDLRLKSLNKRIGLWTHDMHFEEQDCIKSNSCITCGDIA